MSTRADGRAQTDGQGTRLRPRKDWTAINRSRSEDRKKVEQKTRKYFPLTNSVIENHLLGKETIGVFPLSSDETCWFLAVDFDKTRDFRHVIH
jgi:hypothetical protein